MRADEKQVDGQHYKGNSEELQHWNVVRALGWDYYIGAATKYLWRLGKKGDSEAAKRDLQKAIHYLEKRLELMNAGAPMPGIVGLVEPTGWTGFTFTGEQQGVLLYECKLCRSKVNVPLGGVPAHVHECGAEPTAGYVNQ